MAESGIHLLLASESFDRTYSKCLIDWDRLTIAALDLSATLLAIRGECDTFSMLRVRVGVHLNNYLRDQKRWGRVHCRLYDIYDKHLNRASIVIFIVDGLG